MWFWDVVFALNNKQLSLFFLVSICNVPATVLSTLNGLLQLILRTALGDRRSPCFTQETAGTKGGSVTCTRFPR